MPQLPASYTDFSIDINSDKEGMEAECLFDSEVDNLLLTLADSVEKGKNCQLEQQLPTSELSVERSPPLAATSTSIIPLNLPDMPTQGT